MTALLHELFEAQVERHQPVQPLQPDGRIGAAQGATDLVSDQPLAGAGLGERERPGDREDDQGHRPSQQETDPSKHEGCAIGERRRSTTAIFSFQLLDI